MTRYTYGLCPRCGLGLQTETAKMQANNLRMCPCCGLLEIYRDGWMTFTEADFQALVRHDQLRILGFMLAFRKAYDLGLTPTPDSDGAHHA